MEERYYPKRGDYQDHIKWFLQKNPDKTQQEAANFAQSQLGHQIAINRMNIRLEMERIEASLLEMVQMADAIVKGGANESTKRED